MVNFGEKAKMKKAGNLNSGRSNLITTVTKKKFKLAFEEITSRKSIFGSFFLPVHLV